MSGEVYSGSKPAVPYRGVMAALLLLVGTCVLALFMVRTRGDALLGPRMEPKGWDVSIRVPVGFMPVGVIETELGPALRFTAMIERGVSIDLFLWRIDVEEGLAPLEVCEDILRLDLFGPVSRMRLRRVTHPASAPVGSVDGVEVLDPALPGLVRAAVQETRATAVAMVTRGIPISQELHEFFDRSCRSIQSSASARSLMLRGMLNRGHPK
jgi:hypothetical protein